MKKAAQITFCLVFLLFITAPLVALPFWKNKSVENRPLAQLPALVANHTFNMEFPKQMEAYFQDHFGGRTEMIDLYDMLVGNVFAHSANNKVVWGKDGWLFFNETVGDYEGSAPLTKTEMNRLVISLKLLQQCLQARGQELVIAIAPNKNSIYAQYMPTRYPMGKTTTNYTRLMEANTLPCINLKEVFLQQAETLYYRTDTHWNAKGARLAAHKIMLEIEQKTGVAAQLDLSADTQLQKTTKAGDLALMLYPANTPVEEDVTYADAEQNYKTIGVYHTPEDVRITTQRQGAAPVRVYMLRDSFANALVPYLSNAYEHVHYTRVMPVPFETEMALQANVVVLEMAERRLGELLQAAFDVFAPADDAFDTSKIDGQAFVQAQQTMEHIRIWGVAEGVVENLEQVTVMLRKSGEEYVYKAFPILEQAQAQQMDLETVNEDAAFSLLIPKPTEGNYEVYVCQTGETVQVYRGNITLE